eukprot:Skav230923  [mRNA]  locus=scaffold3487:45333:50173:+ [translate_table: standard]
MAQRALRRAKSARKGTGSPNIEDAVWLRQQRRAACREAAERLVLRGSAAAGPRAAGERRRADEAGAVAAGDGWGWLGMAGDGGGWRGMAGDGGVEVGEGMEGGEGGEG